MLIYSKIKCLLFNITNINLYKITFRNKKIYILFDRIGINRIQIISYNVSMILSLFKVQIYNIINDFFKKTFNMNEKYSIGYKNIILNQNRYIILKINKTNILKI